LIIETQTIDVSDRMAMAALFIGFSVALNASRSLEKILISSVCQASTPWPVRSIMRPHRHPGIPARRR
jgi:hypothetical protein